MLEKLLTWADIDSGIRILQEKIGNKKYDWVISINRGGCIPGVMLSEILDAKHGVISVNNYNKKTKKKLEQITKDLYISQNGYIKSHHNVLVVDNVIRSGESIDAAIKAATKVDGDIKNVDTACLHIIGGSSFLPTYSVEVVPSDLWIRYPWEKHEQSGETR